MIYNNTGQLRSWLLKDGRVGIADKAVFDLDDAEYNGHLKALVKAGRPESELQDAAAYRCLTWNSPVPVKEQPKVEAPAPVPQPLVDLLAVDTQIRMLRQQRFLLLLIAILGVLDLITR